MTTQLIKRLRHKGAVSLEFAGMLVVFFIILVTALQAMLAMFSLSQANSAARNAARAEVLNPGSGVAVAQQAVSPGLRKAGVSTSCSGARVHNGSITCKVTVAVPSLGTDSSLWQPTIKVTRSATQPITTE